MPNTEIIIIGTFHGNHINMINYHFGTLEYLINIAKPDILALEIKPKDLKKNNYKFTPPDIANVAIPWAKKNNIAIFGIDSWNKFGRYHYNRFRLKLQRSELGKEKIKSELDEIKIHNDIFINYEDMTVEYIHSEEFSEKDYLVRQNHTTLYGEGPGNLYWYTRTTEMNLLLNDVIEKNRNKRIVIVTGAAHRGDFERFLILKNDIKLIKITDLYNRNDLPSYDLYASSLTAEKLKDTIFMLVQGKKSNTDPDNVNLEIINKLITIYSKTKILNYLQYFLGEYYYLAKQYEKALDYFKNGKANLAKDKMMGLAMTSLIDIRIANMYDLLGLREDAVKIYANYSKRVSRIAFIASYFLKNPCKRPTKEKIS